MKSMQDIFYEKIAGYQQVDMNNITTVNDLEKLGEGIYIINQIPSVNLIKQFPSIYNRSGEVSLFCIENVWLMSISKRKAAYVPTELAGYVRNGGVKFFAHSHPEERDGEQFPSFPDLELCDSIDRKIYIISYLGIMEVDISKAEDFNYLDERWENYLIDSHISFKEYQDNPGQIVEGFLYSLGCEVNLIPYEKENEISELLQSKMNLESDFWKRTSERVPYPGRKK